MYIKESIVRLLEKMGRNERRKENEREEGRMDDVKEKSCVRLLKDGRNVRRKHGEEIKCCGGML